LTLDVALSDWPSVVVPSDRPFEMGDKNPRDTIILIQLTQGAGVPKSTGASAS
jgi:hypothetical protein